MTTYETRHADKGKALHKALKKAGFESSKVSAGSSTRVTHNATPQEFAKIRASLLEKHPSSSDTNWVGIAQNASFTPLATTPAEKPVHWKDAKTAKSWSTRNSELATALEKRLAKKGFTVEPTMLGDINYLDVSDISENEFNAHLDKVRGKLGLL